MIYSRCWLTPFQSRNNTRDTGPISGREGIDDSEWCGFYEKFGRLDGGGMTDASHSSAALWERGGRLRHTQFVLKSESKTQGHWREKTII